MAVWGIDGTDELDADRAVRAGLALQAAVLETAAAASRGLAARVGINTGPALIGAVGSGGELTVMGDTVNVASRLEQAAPIGGVLISHDTYRHIRGVFEVSVREPDRGPRQERADADLRRAERETARLPHRCPRRRRGRDPDGRPRPRAGPPAGGVRTRRRRAGIARRAGHRRGRHREVTAALRPARVARTAQREDPSRRGPGTRRASGNHARADPRHADPALRDPRQRHRGGGRPQVARGVRRGAHAGRRRHGRRLARARHDEPRDHRQRTPRRARTGRTGHVAAPRHQRHAHRDPARGPPLGRSGID